MKLAFSTVACPDWTIEQVVERAAEMGYDGVELRTLGSGSGDLACEPALVDLAKVRSCFAQTGVEPICLSTSAVLHHRDASTMRDTQQRVLDDLEMAALIGCAQVRVFANAVPPGRNRRSVIEHIAHQTVPLLERAADLGIQLLFENAGNFNTAKEWWWLFSLVDHPMLGMCWNVANAAAAGEAPSVSVPCLNYRIRLAKVKDTRVGEGSGFVPLGEGTVDIEQFVSRLLGIGFDGFITVEWDRLWLPSLTLAEEYLPDAIGRLRGLLQTPDTAKKKGFTDAEPMNKELKKILDGAQQAKSPAAAAEP